MIETEEQYLKRMTQNAVKEEKERFADWLEKWKKDEDFIELDKKIKELRSEGKDK